MRNSIYDFSLSLFLKILSKLILKRQKVLTLWTLISRGMLLDKWNRQALNKVKYQRLKIGIAGWIKDKQGWEGNSLAEWHKCQTKVGLKTFKDISFIILTKKYLSEERKKSWQVFSSLQCIFSHWSIYHFLLVDGAKMKKHDEADSSRNPVNLSKITDNSDSSKAVKVSKPYGTFRCI